MKAIVYTEYGPPEVLGVKEVPLPKPKEGEVLIKIRATPVNFGDLMARNFGNVSLQNFNMPFAFYFPARLYFGYSRPKQGVLGSEFSGDIVAVGKGVERFKVGDAVFGYRGQAMGAYAEYLCMAESGTLTHKPSNMSYKEAATVPYGAITALNLLRKVDIKKGEKVLINGASGSIGSYAVQLSKHYGAEVTGVCSTPRVEWVRAMGADRVIDYTREDFTENKQTYDLIFDVLGKSSFHRCKASLKPNGRYLLASFKSRQLWQMLTTKLAGDKKVICALSTDKVEDLEHIKELVEANVITSVIDKTFSMDQAADAHRYIESGLKKGNIVIVMDHDETKEHPQE
ncbi:zinc-binding dehydrogenase [candidate division KSB1 bacterium]|nr:zinc-binding dehydrogenase [candidate division KSB1 bacterium]